MPLTVYRYILTIDSQVVAAVATWPLLNIQYFVHEGSTPIRISHWLFKSRGFLSSAAAVKKANHSEMSHPFQFFICKYIYSFNKRTNYRT